MTNEDLQIKKQELCGEFWMGLRRALDQVGGDSDLIIEAYMDAPLCVFVDLVAPNGIRVTYTKEGHIHHNLSPPDEE